MVSLVGAGPGDAGLLTLKGAERIKNADAVLYDRFVCEEILAMIPETAEKIDVGKNAGNHPVPQEEINRLLLEKAMQGKNVVRLKGGDPFVFGRGGEELELLRQNGVPFEVVPGVTSATAGGAYAGIPVTHRDCASSLHIVTGRGRNGEDPSINYRALVTAGGTLVFMMGVSAVSDICSGCLGAGMDRDTPAAIVENATTRLQRKFVGTVGTLPDIAADNCVKSPAVIIIGEVCRFSEKYDWFTGDPPNGRRVVVPKVREEPSELARRLRGAGFSVTELAVAKTVPITGQGSPVEKAVSELTGYAWLVFTSAAGVNVFFGYLADTGFDVRRLHGVKIACVGPATGGEAAKRGITADYIPEESNGEALARGLSSLARGAGRVLLARAEDAERDLPRILSENGVDFDEVVIYKKERVDCEPIPYSYDFAAFTCSSAADLFAEIIPNDAVSRIKAVCIGGRTAKTARSHGMEAYVSEVADITGLVKKIEELCAL